MNKHTAKAGSTKVVVKTLIQALDDDPGPITATGAADEELNELLAEGWRIGHEHVGTSYNPLKDKWVYTRVIRLERETDDDPAAGATVEVAKVAADEPVPVIPKGYTVDGALEAAAVSPMTLKYQLRAREVFARIHEQGKARRKTQPKQEPRVTIREAVKPIEECTFEEALRGPYTSEERKWVANKQAAEAFMAAYAAVKQTGFVFPALGSKKQEQPTPDIITIDL